MVSVSRRPTQHLWRVVQSRRTAVTSVWHDWLAVALLLLSPLLLAVANFSEPKVDALGLTQHDVPIRAVHFEHNGGSLYPPKNAPLALGSFGANSRSIAAELQHCHSNGRASPIGTEPNQRLCRATRLMEMRLLAQLLTERHREGIERSLRVTLAEELDYYELHKRELVEEPRFTARMLVVYVKGNPAFPEKGLADGQARERATAALSRLRAGDPWDIVVPAYSDEVDQHRKGGLVRDGKFGYFAHELELAIRLQDLGRPGELVRTQFGYHVVEVIERHTERRPLSFESARDIFAEQLNRHKFEAARASFMRPIWEEVGFKLEAAGMNDASLLTADATPPDAVLAVVAGHKVLERDFRWYLRDALLPKQQIVAFSRPSARQSALRSYLDLLVLEAKARLDGLDRSEHFLRNRDAEAASLQAELTTEIDQESRPSSMSRR